MPVVQVHLKEGRTVEQKRQLVEKISQDLVEICGSNPQRIHIIITDVPADNWGVEGKLLSSQ
jgi:4-oxalocrotonate tautomerase